MTRDRTLLVVMLCGLTAAALALVIGLRVRAARVRYTWDFTKGRDAASLGIPRRSEHNPFNQFHEVPGPAVVRVRFDATHTYAGRIVSATFSQSTPGTVDDIQLFLEAQTVDAAYETAMRLAREWDLRTQPLDNWYRAVTHGGQPYNERTIRNDIYPSCDVELLMTYHHDKPYHVMLQVGWLDGRPGPRH